METLILLVRKANLEFLSYDVQCDSLKVNKSIIMAGPSPSPQKAS